jgi:hypothetical protein
VADLHLHADESQLVALLTQSSRSSHAELQGQLTAIVETPNRRISGTWYFNGSSLRVEGTAEPTTKEATSEGIVGPFVLTFDGKKQEEWRKQSFAFTSSETSNVRKEMGISPWYWKVDPRIGDIISLYTACASHSGARIESTHVRDETRFQLIQTATTPHNMAEIRFGGAPDYEILRYILFLDANDSSSKICEGIYGWETINNIRVPTRIENWVRTPPLTTPERIRIVSIADIRFGEVNVAWRIERSAFPVGTSVFEILGPQNQRSSKRSFVGGKAGELEHELRSEAFKLYLSQLEFEG